MLNNTRSTAIIFAVIKKSFDTLLCLTIFGNLVLCIKVGNKIDTLIIATSSRYFFLQACMSMSIAHHMLLHARISNGIP